MLKQINTKLKALETFLTTAVKKKLVGLTSQVKVNISLDASRGNVQGYVYLHVYTNSTHIGMYYIVINNNMSNVEIRRELLRELDVQIVAIKKALELELNNQAQVSAINSAETPQPTKGNI